MSHDVALDSGKVLGNGKRDMGIYDVFLFSIFLVRFSYSYFFFSKHRRLSIDLGFRLIVA